MKEEKNSWQRLGKAEPRLLTRRRRSRWPSGGLKKINLTGILLLLLLVCFECDKERNQEANKEEFCLYLHSENRNKTLPVINDYLKGLKSSWSEEQKIQALTEWLKSCPCVLNASISCVSCIYTDPPQSEINISFQENGKTEDFILDISMSNPLKAVAYHVHE
jgi:hypothetical protein